MIVLSVPRPFHLFKLKSLLWTFPPLALDNCFIFSVCKPGYSVCVTVVESHRVCSLLTGSFHQHRVLPMHPCCGSSQWGLQATRVTVITGRSLSFIHLPNSRSACVFRVVRSAVLKGGWTPALTSRSGHLDVELLNCGNSVFVFSLFGLRQGTLSPTASASKDGDYKCVALRSAVFWRTAVWPS